MAIPTPPHPQTAAATGLVRIWFHLDDVVPLALHAVNSPRQAITAAQLAASAPLLPALIWESGPDGDTLASDGLPGWHDQDGHLQVARAHTWVIPAAAKSNRSEGRGYPPLVSPGQRLPRHRLVPTGRSARCALAQPRCHHPASADQPGPA